jgi:SAM-dependent methyltransferase
MSGSEQSPLAGIPPATLFGGLSDEAWRWLQIEGPSRCPFLADYLPSQPPSGLQAHFVVHSDVAALEQGFQIYDLFKQLYERHARPLALTDRVLDFGCGWGRVIRFFLKDVAAENLVGIDVDPEAIEASRATNRWCTFKDCDVFPPSGFEADSFDLVYAYSVFSHLSEEAHERWLAEFERILKPGGVLIATTLHRAFIVMSSIWQNEGNVESLPDWQQQAVRCLTPREKWLPLYDRGEFVFGAPDARAPHFGFACIPHRYIRKHWKKHFVVRELIHFRDLGEYTTLGQEVIVCRKRRRAR